MKTIDLITIIEIIFGLVWGTFLFFLWRRNKLKPKASSRIFGIGAGVYGFISMMTASLLLSPISEFADYTIANFLWSLAVGIIGSISGHVIERRMLDKK